MADTKLPLYVRRSKGELAKITAIIGKSPQSYQGILEALGGVFLQLYSPKINASALKSAADALNEKAMRLNDSGDNLDIKDNCMTFAVRMSKLDASDIKPFVDALKAANISEFIDLLTSQLSIQLGVDPGEADRKRHEAEEADRKRREAEEAERKRREAEEAARRRREAEEAERLRKKQEQAAFEFLQEHNRKVKAELQRKEAARKRKEAARKRARTFRNILIFAVAAAALWFFWLKDVFNGASDEFVYVEDLIFRSSPDPNADDNIIEVLPYGTQVKVLEKSDEGWSKVRIDGKKGYVASSYLLSSDDFQLLDSIWDDDFDPSVRELVPTAFYRLALLDYLKRDTIGLGREQWRLSNNPDRGYNNVAYPDLNNGYDIVKDFAFILKNPYAGRREVILYSFDENANPVYVYQEQADDFPPLKDVSYNKKKDRYVFEYVTKKTKKNKKDLIPTPSTVISKYYSPADASEKTLTTEKKKENVKTKQLDSSEQKNSDNAQASQSGDGSNSKAGITEQLAVKAAEVIDNSADNSKETTQPAKESDNNVYTAVEIMAKFNGGDVALMRWLSNNIRYPKAAQENGVQGRVVVKFIVEKDGSISHPEVVRGKDKDLDQEALRLVGSMPKWLPAKKGGEPVRCYFTIPVNFKLQ